MRLNIEKQWDGYGWVSLALSPLSFLYSVGWLAYQSIYVLGLKRPHIPALRTVCVGNLLVGGSGKTPTTRRICRLLSEMGFSVVVGVSGYGSPRQHEASLAPVGPLDPAEWGDEGALMRSWFPETPLVVGRDRVLAAKLAAEAHPGHILLMDDGYQHLRLLPQTRILIDLDPPPNRLCLPAGPYREPRGTGRRRADLTLPGRFRISPTQAPFRLSDGGIRELAGQVDVLCAIARPQALLESLKSDGLTLGTVKLMPDHDPLTEGNLLDDFERSTTLVVTSKDWVKLRRRPDLGGRLIVIADVDVAIEPEAEFCDWLKKRLS